MKTFLITAAIAATVGATAANAATLDFTAEANGNERGLMDGTVITMDGVDVTFSSNFFAYLDSGNAGLGVCQSVTDFSNGGSVNRCASGAGDDNITAGEVVTIGFNFAMTLSDLLFVEEGHQPFGSTAGSNDQTLLFGVNGGALSRYTFGELAMATFEDVTNASFAFDDGSFTVGDDRGLARNAEQFYVGAATVAPVPVPAALGLMVAALGGLAGLRRSRKTA